MADQTECSQSKSATKFNGNWVTANKRNATETPQKSQFIGIIVATAGSKMISNGSIIGSPKPISTKKISMVRIPSIRISSPSITNNPPITSSMPISMRSLCLFAPLVSFTPRPQRGTTSQGICYDTDWNHRVRVYEDGWTRNRLDYLL